MTIAEIHGKLSPDRPNGVNERMEDLLTSDVFGTMKYAGWDKGFLKWLMRAIPVSINSSTRPMSEYFNELNIVDVKYSFWPKLNNNREPDVALLLISDEGDALIILVEAKYFSGTSNWEEDQVSDIYGRTGNQIIDQVQGLSSMTNDDILEWFPTINNCSKIKDNIKRIHLFITIHSTIPHHEYEVSKKHLSGNSPLDCYWLSWTTLAKLLKPYCSSSGSGPQSMLNDLHDLLIRKDLVPFEGFHLKTWNVPDKYSSFWGERWWDFKGGKFKKYQSFLVQKLWQYRSPPHVSYISFWNGG